MEKFSLKQLMLALGCMSCLSSVILIKPTERITGQKEAGFSRSTTSKRCMSAVFPEQENAKKVRQESIALQPDAGPAQITTQKAGSRRFMDSFLPKKAKKARQESSTPSLTPTRAQANSSQRKAGLRTVTRSRLLSLPENAKKARQEIEAVAPQQKAFAPQSNIAPTDVQQLEIARLKKEVEALSDMFRSACLSSANKAHSDAQNGGELALTQTILQSTILNTEKARLAHEQKNAESEAELMLSRAVVTSMASNAEELRLKAEELRLNAQSHDLTIEQLTKKAQVNARRLQAFQKAAQDAMKVLRIMPGTEKEVACLEFKKRMGREARLYEENSH